MYSKRKQATYVTKYQKVTDWDAIKTLLEYITCVVLLVLAKAYVYPAVFP